MSFEALPPTIYIKNNTKETFKKIRFKFEEGKLDSKIKKIKPNAKEQTAIPLWGVPLVSGAYLNLNMIYEVDSKVIKEIVLDRYDKRMSLLIEITSIKDDGSFKFTTQKLEV